MARLRSLIPLAVLLTAGVFHALPAAASTKQESLFQDDIRVKVDPVGTLRTLYELGVTRVRVSVNWDSVAPNRYSHHRPAGFAASNPAARGYDFSMYDRIDRAAAAQGIKLDFMLTAPAPLWATAPGAPGGTSLALQGLWKPSSSEFAAFAAAMGKRYSGTFKSKGSSTPLPRVSFWTIWNEPNYGMSLAPQTIYNNSVETDAALYRGLVDGAWKGLTSTGHTTRTDAIVFGEVAPRGVSRPGTFSGVKPLRFLRALYCVDSGFGPLRGIAALLRGCPTTAAGSRAFRSQNPALFQASGFADHLYTSQSNPQPPTVATNEAGRIGADSDFADLPGLRHTIATLDRLNAVYGSSTKFPIWNTEYGYRTRPPDPRSGVSPATAAMYMNWAEYLSWRQPRLRDYMQYLLQDPSNGYFASGLLGPNGTPKVTMDAYRLPLYLPRTSGRVGSPLEVWGAVRPGPAAALETSTIQHGTIQFKQNGQGIWRTLATVTASPADYFDMRLSFPASGSIRLMWVAPLGWSNPVAVTTYHSRTVQVTVR